MTLQYEALPEVRSALTPDESAQIGLDIADAVGLSARLYRDPAVYELEKERIFRRHWMPAFHQASIPNPGDYRVLDLWGESFLFVRGDDHKIRAFHNICLHRGAQLTEQESGNCSRFRCPYHTWTYDLEGKLSGAPLMGRIVKEGRSLREVAVDTFLGFVFINDDGNAPPLAEQWAGLAEHLAPWVAVSDELANTYEVDHPYELNWKLLLQNGAEGYHVMGTHLETAGALIPGQLTYSVTEHSGETWSSFYMPFGEGADMRDTTGGALALENLPEWVDKEYRYYVGFPGIIFAAEPSAIFAGIIRPGATVGEASVTWTPASLKASRELLNWEDYKKQQTEFSYIVQGEDGFPCKTMWASTASPAFQPGPYSPGEVSVYDFDQWYLRQLAG